jgi:hypothetical protein
MKKVKGKKKETSRQKSRETDEFDDLLDKYKEKFLKRFKTNAVKAGKTDKSVVEGEFEEADWSN